MTDLHQIQSQIVERIEAASVGSGLKFALMDAADAMTRAIKAEAREAGKEEGR